MPIARLPRFSPIARPARCLGLTLACLAPWVAVSCGSAPETVPPEITGAATGVPSDPLPDGLLVRFRDVRGEGLAREGWEIEILQMLGEIHVRGSLRTGGAAVPVLRPMGIDEYREFWQWIRSFPLDGFRVQEDPNEPEASWRKTFEVDVVVGDRRDRCRNTWSRPVVDTPWLTEVENRLHEMVLRYAEDELDRIMEVPDTVPAPINPDDALNAGGPATPQEAYRNEVRPD